MPDKVRPTSPTDAEVDQMWIELEARGLSLKKQEGGQTDDEEEGMNELDRLKQLELIKQMPVKISVKRKLR